MDFQELLHIVGDEPLFESALLLAGEVDPADLRRQLSRWVRAGKLLQLRRGLYALAPPYRKRAPHPFVVSNALLRASYVSLQSALAHYGLIPEYTPTVTAVTTRRPSRRTTPLGDYTYRHIKVGTFHGYRRLDLGEGQQAFVATPEKALLDLVYLEPGGDERAYLESLRLQNLERLDLGRLAALAKMEASPKLARAATVVASLARAESEYEAL